MGKKGKNYDENGRSFTLKGDKMYMKKKDFFLIPNN